MLSYRLGTVNDIHWEFKLVLSYSKPHTFSTFLEKKKKAKMYLLSPTKVAISHADCASLGPSILKNNLRR